ncbi:hypothetical protein ND16A_2375 [Thalassotalea sp. ND16A]|nr:hypothetical protein ND16A_2375 [Thalassotalea sp. ND16A]
MANQLKYLSAYAADIQTKIQQLIDDKRLARFLLNKYPTTHHINNDKKLRQFVLAIKDQYLKKSAPLSKITFDNKIHVINNALGLHTYVSRVQGGKLKAKNEIRIAAIFKHAPIEFLTMIVVHELI